MTESGDAEVDQVRGTGKLESGERDNGSLDDSADTECHGDHKDVGTQRIAGNCGERSLAAVRQRPADDEQDARPRHDDQYERHRRERQQSVSGDHERSLSIDRLHGSFTQRER